MSGNRCALVSFILKAKFLHNVISIFTLGNKYTIFHLFHLESKKIGKFTNHVHLKSSLHLLDKNHHFAWHPSKHNIINIYRSYDNISILLLHKQSLVESSPNITMHSNKFRESLIPSHGGLFKARNTRIVQLTLYNIVSFSIIAKSDIVDRIWFDIIQIVSFTNHVSWTTSIKYQSSLDDTLIGVHAILI